MDEPISNFMSLFEMALSLKPARTGLPFVIWISEKIYAPACHLPRLKVYDKGSETSVSINDPVQVLAGAAITGKAWKNLVQYIEINRQLLLDLWEERIDQVDYGNHQTPIG